MRKLPLSHGLLYFLDELEFSEAGLSADPDAQSLAAPFQETLEEWDGLFKKERSARRAVVRSEAAVAVHNERLDSTTIRFGAMVRGVAPALMNRLFTMAPGKLVRRGLRQQCEKTRDVILVELGKLEDAHPLKPFAAQLGTLVDAALSALDSRAQAKGARQTIASDIEEWKEGVNALRTTTYAELLKISADKGYPRSWVESFFRTASAASDPSDEDAESPATSTPEPT
ncbi:hypothetical protein [Polyangium aurulentum]|uniref:hypothetical protein n=1 Tax=Polyangium aurulentum TaxID=2567896 RepID=UPI0010AE6DF6|nr:hypothetical protein [Polyangium aurulentum]UQA55831.1 hypothetical protein E8A73_031445 [Polyangium aurulentum]